MSGVLLRSGGWGGDRHDTYMSIWCQLNVNVSTTVVWTMLFRPVLMTRQSSHEAGMHIYAAFATPGSCCCAKRPAVEVHRLLCICSCLAVICFASGPYIARQLHHHRTCACRRLFCSSRARCTLTSVSSRAISPCLRLVWPAMRMLRPTSSCAMRSADLRGQRNKSNGHCSQHTSARRKHATVCTCTRCSVLRPTSSCAMRSADLRAQ